MTNARSVTPVDLPALLTSTGRYRNQAWPRERLGADASPSPLSVVLDKFVTLGRGRSAWVTTERQRLQGLVAARPRAERSAWEIDYLIEGSDADDLPALIDRAITETGEDGAEKLFVRLEAGSDLLPVFREAGFQPYREERLYHSHSFVSRMPAGALQPMAPSDSYPLFRLYNQATPEPERRCEAATFAEWHATQDRRWLKRGLELVQERQGKYAAYLRAGKLPWGTLVDVLVDAESAREADALVTAAATAAGVDALPIYVIVPRSAEAVARCLEDAGYVAEREFVCLMHRTTVLRALPRAVPAVARHAARA